MKVFFFFASKNQTSALVEFYNLNLVSEESRRHFAHQINYLASINLSVDRDITDAKFLKILKLHKFISVCHLNLRIKLQEEEVSNFITRHPFDG